MTYIIEICLYIPTKTNRPDNFLMGEILINLNSCSEKQSDYTIHFDSLIIN